MAEDRKLQKSAHGAGASDEQRQGTADSVFDPRGLAAEVMAGSVAPPSPEGGAPESEKERTPTLTDPLELEAARQRTISVLPPSELSLVNRNSPSLPPAASSRPITLLDDEELSPLDKAWLDEDEEKPHDKQTAPPPVGGLPAEAKKSEAPTAPPPQLGQGGGPGSPDSALPPTAPSGSPQAGVTGTGIRKRQPETTDDMFAELAMEEAAEGGAPDAEFGLGLTVEPDAGQIPQEAIPTPLPIPALAQTAAPPSTLEAPGAAEEDPLGHLEAREPSALLDPGFAGAGGMGVAPKKPSAPRRLEAREPSALIPETRPKPDVSAAVGLAPPLDATDDLTPFAELPPSKTSGSGRTKPPHEDMRDRFSLGDYTGALEVAEQLLAQSPDDPEARDCAEQSRTVLIQMYTAKIGPLDRVPLVMVPREQLRWLSIDHRAGFVLSHIDGVSSLEMILDVSGMPTLDAMRILCELHQQRIISFR
jgi:hypothetical protein